MEFWGGGSPRRPVISSLASAAREFNLWVRENGYQTLPDQSGAMWELMVQERLVPHPTLPSGALHHLRLGLRTSIDRANLVKTGVFDSQADARLLSLMASASIGIRLLGREQTAQQIEELRRRFAAELERLREYLKKNDFREIKRRCVGSWVDRHRVFGYRAEEDDFILEI